MAALFANGGNQYMLKALLEKTKYKEKGIKESKAWLIEDFEILMGYTFLLLFSNLRDYILSILAGLIALTVL